MASRLPDHGPIVPPELPEAERILAVSRRLSPGDTEFVLFYRRPDAAYEKWSVWTWSDQHSGRVIPFSGVADGVAYLRLERSAVAGRSGTVNFIVRTDGWEKDPGVDQSWNLAGGGTCAVFSGDPRVHAAGETGPRLLSASPREASPGRWSVSVRTLGRMTLLPPGELRPASRRSQGFRFDPRLNFACSGSGTVDEFRLEIFGPVKPGRAYRLVHPGFAGALEVTFPPEPPPAPPLPASVRRRLPEPILEGRREWIDLYWAAWRFMHEKITRGDVSKGFVSRYIDEGFNENIFQWDSCFMAAYALYGLPVFPAMAALDNFYNHQRASDGYICRCYDERTGLATGENDINPPLFAWVEWKYWKVTGDTSRLGRVLPVLDRYFAWCKANARGERGQGLYFITDLGSGMDNSPREEFVRRGAWIDLSAQQALAALSIARLARVAGDEALAGRYDHEYAVLRDAINDALWCEDDGLYYDRTEEGAWHRRKTIASFWPMLAEIASSEQASALIELHLKNPSEFFRPHLFPTLSADDPVYDPGGHYWRGGVWAPTNYAVIKGVERYDRAFAREAAENHVERMARVFSMFVPGPDRPLPPLTETNIPRNGDGLKQIWEAYSPEEDAPATRWDATQLVRQKFCGWSGLGPVALLIENILGFEVNGAERTLTWRIGRLERHGARRLRVGDAVVTLIASRRNNQSEAIRITGTATRPFRLVVYDIDAETPLVDRWIGRIGRFRISIASQ